LHDEIAGMQKALVADAAAWKIFQVLALIKADGPVDPWSGGVRVAHP
jgi:hypothetical protein